GSLTEATRPAVEREGAARRSRPGRPGGRPDVEAFAFTFRLAPVAPAASRLAVNACPFPLGNRARAGAGAPRPFGAAAGGRYSNSAAWSAATVRLASGSETTTWRLVFVAP